MTSQTEKLLNEVLELPLPMRALIAEKLIESLDEDKDVNLSDVWKKEIEKRCQELDDNQVTLIDSEIVFQKALKAIE
jgi:putative addiction module component (TIGR02574 family)